MMYTSPEKYKRDRRRFNVNPANGDKITYVHLNRPEFELFGRKFKFHLKGRDWQMRIMRHCRWLRGLMPTWHHREKGFREWYTQLVDSCDLNGAQDGGRYNLWLEIFKSPEPVTGYREVRYPKMDVATQKVAELQHALANGSADGKFRGTRTVSLSGQVMGTFRGA
jgi:indolepyruvate ferredoxin oxidoreductase